MSLTVYFFNLFVIIHWSRCESTEVLFLVVCTCRLCPEEVSMSEMASTGKVKSLQKCIIIHQ